MSLCIYYIAIFALYPYATPDAARLSRLDKGDAAPTKDAAQIDAAKRMLATLAAAPSAQKTTEDDLGMSMAKISADVDSGGATVLRASQLYKGYRVVDAHAVMHRHEEHTVSILSKDDRMATGEQRAVRACTQHFGQIVNGIDEDIEMGKLDKFQPDATSVLNKLKEEARGPFSSEHAETIVYLDENNRAKLGYVASVKYFDGNRNYNPNKLIDVETGKVVRQWDGIHYIASQPNRDDVDRRKRQTVSKARLLPSGSGGGGNIKTGTWYYGRGKQKFLVTVYPNGTCAMETKYARVVHYFASYPDRFTYVFNCSLGSVNDSANGAKSPINDATFIVNNAYAMYVSWYGEPALSASGKGRGGDASQVLVLSHYAGGAETTSNGSGSATFGGGEMDVPDGNKYMWYPNAVGDVLAHELAHGVTEQTAVLETLGGHTNMADGLNEAFSDMAGKAYERYMYGKRGVKWGVGVDMMKGSLPLRYMDEPTRPAAQDVFYAGQTSIGNAADFKAPMNNHLSSGVFNKAFYCMAQRFQNDVWDAFDLFYVSNTRYWCPSTNFTQAAELMLAATEDIQAGKWAQVPWGYTWIKTSDITDCYKQVGINCAKPGGKLDVNAVQNCNGTTTWSCNVA